MARDITKLHPALQAKVQLLITECEKAGLKIGISECVRTVAEQDALYAKGRTTSGSIVTNARGSSYSSMHQWGVAFDFYRNDGKGAYYDKDGFFSKVGAIGKAIGLEWGGSWKSPVDKPHFQLPNWGSTPSVLKKTYGTPTNFMASWGGVTTTAKVAQPTIRSGSKGENAKLLQANLNQTVSAGLALDGSFGPKSVLALKKWQAAVGLTADGVYGNNSYKIMANLIK